MLFRSRTIKQGSQVQFDLVQGPKGQLAQNITPLEAARNSLEPQPQQMAS